MPVWLHLWRCRWSEVEVGDIVPRLDRVSAPKEWRTDTRLRAHVTPPPAPTPPSPHPELTLTEKETIQKGRGTCHASGPGPD